MVAMHITAAASFDVEQIAGCLAGAFADDPITGYLLGAEADSREHLTRFFSLLARARMALGMPVLVARGTAGVQGVAMGNSIAPPPWPSHLDDEWSRIDTAIPGFNDRATVYDQIAERSRPAEPHCYLGAIGTNPSLHGLGIGTSLLERFCDLSAADRRSSGVYLETANPSNVRFYERAGFSVVGQGTLGSSTLWCMLLRHEPRHGA